MRLNSCPIKLEVLEKRIKAFSQGYRQNLALLGDDAQETSYLLENYLLSAKPKDIACLHTTTAYAEKEDFFKIIALSLLRDYLNQNNTLDNLINLAGDRLKSTSDFIKNCLKEEKFSFLNTLEVINKFINETGRRCMLIIEEFLRLEDIFGKEFYQDFSKFIILQKSCMTVLTASRPTEAQKVLSDKLNLLFGNFENVFLSETTSLNSFAYLKNRLEPVSPSSFFLSFFVDNIGTNSVYYDLLAKIRGAMIYPIFIIGGLVAVGTLMMIFVIPQLTVVLSETGVDLPMSTKILIAASNFFTNYWWLLLIILIVAVVVLRVVIRTSPGRRYLDTLKLKLPIFGKLFQKIILVRFSRSLYTLLTGGVALTKSLQIVSDVVGNVVYKEIIKETAAEVEDGNPIATVFLRRKEIPAMVSQMLNLGEK
ncbi:MAG: type II secretion system F family protein, partial [Candidatus Omnitrophota bacterium]